MIQTTLIAQHSGGHLIMDAPLYHPGQEARLAGARIVQSIGQYTFVGLENSLFRVEHLGNGSFRIISELSDMVFDVAGASQASGTPVILWPWHGGPNQRFRLKGQPRLSNRAWGFSLEAEHSGKVLDVLGASGSWGAELVQWDYHGGPNQFFRVFGSPIKPRDSELVLDVANGSQDSGASVVLWPWHGGPNQLFRLEYVGDGSYRVVTEHSGKVLDVEGASHEDGAKLIQWDWHGGPNQLFRLSAQWGEYFLMARHSGKYLGVAGSSLTQGAQLVQVSGSALSFHL